MEFHFSERSGRITSSAIREILKVTQDSSIVSFAGGLPAPETFPVEELRRIHDQVLAEAGPAALQYSTTQGYLPLREYIALALRKRNIDLGPDNIVITAGSQQCLDLLGKVLIDEDDVVVGEKPGYLGAIQAFEVFGRTVVQVEMDDEGVDPEAFRAALEKHRPPFAYLIPNFQNPSGRTYSAARRETLARMSAEMGVPIVEDDPYGALRFAGEYVDPIKSFPGGEDGVYISSFSKVISPGLRLGFMVAPMPVVEKVIMMKQAADLHTSTLSQMVSYEFFRQGFLRPQRHKIRQVYGTKKAIMYDALVQHFTGLGRWTNPEGGMFIWVELDSDIDTTELLKRALAKKVAFVPGSVFFVDGGGTNCLRLNYTNSSDGEIQAGIGRLAEAVREMVEAL